MGRRGNTRSNSFAIDLFSPLAGRYDRLCEVLSMGQNRRWRRCMVDHTIAGRPVRVLDVASGTAGVAIALAERTSADVVAFDLTLSMLREGAERVAQAGLDARVALVEGQAEDLPFANDSFDALTFTYLLRYVDDPKATIAELARVVGPGGWVASLEFLEPPNPVWRGAWWCYSRLLLPVAGWMTGGREWWRVGRFLGPNISEHYRRYPLDWTVEAWESAGLEEIGVRPMSLGGGVVMWGAQTPWVIPLRLQTTPRPGRSNPPSTQPDRVAGAEWWTLLHPPYTLWHLSYVVIGASLAPIVRVDRLVATVLAFFFAVGVAAHALDELNGRPLNTKIASRSLIVAAVLGLGVAIALGAIGVSRVGWTIVPFIVVGPVMVVAYNTDIDSRHKDVAFAAAWGAFPVLTAYVAEAGTLRWPAVLAASGAFGFSAAQRSLSTPARMLRRRTFEARGSLTMTDGSERRLDRETLLRPLERALHTLSASMVLVATSLVLARLS